MDSTQVEVEVATAVIAAGRGDCLFSSTGGRLDSAPLLFGDWLLGKLELVRVGELVDCECVAPGCDVCCANFARLLV
jgi:hypothetical protein